MGAPVAQIAQPTQNKMLAQQYPQQQQIGGGKGNMPPPVKAPISNTQVQEQPIGKGQPRNVMYSPISNQPTMCQPNPYSNTIGQWDNASIQPQTRQIGKGKGF